MLLLVALLALGMTIANRAEAVEARRPASLSVTVTPAATGRQLVRMALPLPRGFLREGETLMASDGKREIPTAVRRLTWYPNAQGQARSARRALVTFPYIFARSQPVRFVFRPAPSKPMPARFAVSAKVEGEAVTIAYRNGPTLTARLIAPARQSTAPPRVETVESNAYFLWQRVHLPDPQWPREIEIRADALGGVVLRARLQRDLPGNAYAPDLGWEVEAQTTSYEGYSGTHRFALGSAPFTHTFAEGEPCSLLFSEGRYRLAFPTAPYQRRGRIEARLADGVLHCRYLRCTAEENVPMQQAAWRRADLVIAPTALAPLTPTLESPHTALCDWRLWDALYQTGPPLKLDKQPELAALLRYHHDAITHAAALGDDWGNVTGFNAGSASGGAFGMNRLNHCPAVFEEGYRSGDRRLIETGVLWCENFTDQTIWWGPNGTGGTRYNNLKAMGQTPPDDATMWRSNSAVDFCTKGYDTFLYAYEETGDPHLLEALHAQADYALEHIHADRGEARNIGDARDFVRLYRYTGEKRFLDAALRLFRELRAKLSAGDLFDQGGKPIVADPPFIEEDAKGLSYPYAKPYIIGYALAGLPELAPYFPDEPKLRDVVRAVADFMAGSQDPVGGWRYPHPRSSYTILDQAMEHAWQLTQADRLLGPQEAHLDAIERVLRQRFHGWRKTGTIFSGLQGWEMATGKVKQQSEIYDLYKRPADRDFTRDYTEGKPGFGSASPEGLVYFPEVLAFYLQRRPASRLLTPPQADEPLGKVLARVPEKRS